MKHIEQDLLKKLLHYDPESGVFTWKKRTVSELTPNKRGVNVFNSLHENTIAGNISTSEKSKTSYVNIKLLNETFKAHRLAFIYMEGEAPEEVDHIDHDGLNNKWDNLRASTNKDNSKNLPMQKSNKTGVIGVNWHKAAKKWQARAVNKDGKRIDLGRYDDFVQAVEARKKHEIEFGYYENRGAL